MNTDLAKTDNGGSGAMVEVATGRVIQEVQAAMTIAKRFPRDVTAAIERIRQACKRTGLAEQAVYQYPRGGTKVQGPSIRLAEAMAQNWGNLDFGIIELEQRGGESDVMAYCWDLETNTRQTKVFTVKHERHTRQGITDLSDPRDVYEMVANQGARRMRACILGVIPGDVQDKAVDQCRQTLAGDSAEPITDRLQKMVAAFADLGVSKEMIERRLGYNLTACDEHGLVGLRSVYTSLRDGMSKREDWFDVETAESVASHREQARAARESAREPEGQSAAEGSQLNPAVDKSQGTDEPTPQQILERLRAHLEVVITLKAVDELKEQGFALLPIEMAEMFAADCEARKAEIRAKRGERTNKDGDPEFSKAASATEQGQ